MTRTRDGYLRIKTRGPLRDKLAHRAYVERQLGRPLRPDEVIHHVCGNKACFPPTDFHLCLMDFPLHAAFEAGATPWQKHRARYGNKSGTKSETKCETKCETSEISEIST